MDNITVRTNCKRGRATYHPEWSPTLPWVCYIDGEAMVHKLTLQDCARWFQSKRLVLPLPNQEKGA